MPSFQIDRWLPKTGSLARLAHTGCGHRDSKPRVGSCGKRGSCRALPVKDQALCSLPCSAPRMQIPRLYSLRQDSGGFLSGTRRAQKERPVDSDIWGSHQSTHLASIPAPRLPTSFSEAHGKIWAGGQGAPGIWNEALTWKKILTWRRLVRRRLLTGRL